MSGNFNIQGFTRVKHQNVDKRGKIVITYGAICENCNHHLSNSALPRLISHKKMCERKREKASNESQGTEEIILEEIIINCDDNTGEFNQQGTSLQQSTDSNDIHGTRELNFKRARESASPPSKIPRLQPKIDKCFNNVKENRAHGDSLLCKFFYSSNIPFSVVESLHFRNFVKFLNPSYVIPNRKALGEDLLDKTYDELVNSKKSEERKKGTLMVDGWKNKITGRRFVTGIIKPRYEPALVVAQEDFTDMPESADNLEEFALMCFDKCIDMYNVEVEAVTTDNARNVTSFRNKLNVDNYGCMPHAGNLQLKTETDTNLFEEVHAINVEIKNSMFIHEKIQKLGGKKVYIGTDVRWKSRIKEMIWLSENMGIVRQVVALPEFELTQENQCKIFDGTFKKRLNDEITKMEPLTNFIDITQSDECSLGVGLHEWLKLKIPDDPLQRERFLSRQTYVKHNNSMISYLLTPNLRGTLLSENERNTLIWSLQSKISREATDNDELFAVEDYIERKGKFASESLTKLEDNPEKYWLLVKRFSKQLGELGHRYCSYPAGTAELERSFSELGFIHDKRRNRLLPLKTEKLLLVHSILNRTDKKGNKNNVFIEK